VLLVGIGDTAEPQARLDTATRNRLVEHWKAISSASGATCVEVDAEPLTAAPASGLPQVTRVRVPAPVQPKIDVGEQVALREDSVGFVDSSAELRDPAAAKAALAPLAREIRAGGYRVSLVGTTASAGTEQGRLTLSRERAEKVRRLLVDLGVPDHRISTRGVGTHHPQHVDDLDDGGNLVPEKAVKNRAVFISVRR
jgi:OOP family OmpA-OmpF porin